MRVAIITSSDSGYAGEREDKSGPVIAEMVTAAGYTVVSQEILPDDYEMLTKRMAEICDSHGAELILTTGGTGFSVRDIMPEATAAVCERMVPGIPEAMPKAVRESLEFILPSLGHGLEILTGEATNCART